MIKEKIILIGGGGHCKSCIDVIELDNRFEVIAIIDLPENIGKEILSYKITHCDLSLEELVKEYSNVLITIGQIKSPNKRIDYFNKLDKWGAKFPVIISPRAHVSKYAKIEKGTIVMHDCVVNADARIGANSILNSKSLIEHDAVVGKHCHISTAATVNGGAIIGEGTFIGSNAVVRDNISIRSFQVIPAGASILREV